MSASEKHLKLVISAYTQGAEDGLKNISGSFSRLRSDLPGTAKALEAAGRALDVRTMRSVNQEVEALRKNYRLLRDNGVLAQKELAQAAANLKTKTAALRAEYAQANITQKQGIAVTSNLTGHVKRLVAAYLGYRAVTAVIGGMVGAARNAEQAQFNLASSVEAAGREFSNTGSLDHWKGKVGEMAGALKVYSEADVANAISRTVDMTKRLGLSAEQMEVLIKRSADLGAGKTDLEGAIERTTAALRGEAESAEFLGLTLNETYIAAWHATHEVHGKAWKDLTDLEKAQVRYQVLLEQSDGIQGKAAGSAATLGGALQEIKSQVSDAVANNKDFAGAMTALAATIRENADEIGEWAADLATAIGSVIEFVVENKTLILTLVGAGGTLYAVNAVAKGISGLAGTVDALRKAKMAQMAVETAGGLGQMATGAAGASSSMGALSVLINPYAVALVAATAATVGIAMAIRGWRDAAVEADLAHFRLTLNIESNLQRFEKYKGFRLPGLDGKTAEELQTIQGELAKTYGYWATMVTNLQVKAEETGWFGQMTAEAKAAAAQLPEVEARLAQVKAELGLVGAALTATGAAGSQSLLTMEQALYQVEQAALRFQEKQDLLTAAMTRARDEQGMLEAKVKELAAAYYEAAVALKATQEGTEEHAKALATKLDAESAYVSAVKALHDKQMQDTQQDFAADEKELRQHLDRELIELEDQLKREWITQAKFNHRKAEADQQLTEEILEMRRKAAEQSMELYGEESREYRQARMAMVDAELAVQRAASVTSARWKEVMREAIGGSKAADQLAESLEAVGEAGERGGNRAAAGIRQVARAAEDGANSIKRLKTAITADEGGAGGGAAEGGAGTAGVANEGIAGWFAGVWNNISKMATDMKSLDEIRAYRQQNYKTLNNFSGLRDSQGFFMALNKHADDALRQRSSELMDLARGQMHADTAAIREAAAQASGPLAAGARGAARTVAVQFKAPNGQSVSGQFEEGEASRLLDVLRQSGAVTA